MNRPYKICTRCVMDTSAMDITFDDHGACSYCTRFLRDSARILHGDPAKRREDLEKFVAAVKAGGKGRKYDCIIGVSGGVDSSWGLVQAVRLGLRPLAVHMDNGWNSELAQHNIANLVRGLGVDLYTHVIDWDEYRNLMQAFFDADVIDVELLYDNAMLAVNYQQATRQGLKFILAGSNTATEGMSLPPRWRWLKMDRRNIEALGHRFGGVRLKSFPSIGVLGYVWQEFVARRNWIPFIDFFEYNKFDALRMLQEEFGYKPYPYKHYESIFTRFYQGYLLPKKFGVDKRRTHLGTLVATGQMSREAALKDLEGLPYPSEKALDEDRRYFLKKMGWTREDLDAYIARPEKRHDVYPTEKRLWDFFFSDHEGRKGYKAAKAAYRMLRGLYRGAVRHLRSR